MKTLQIKRGAIHYRTYFRTFKYETYKLSVNDSQTTDDYALPYIENDGEIKAVPFRNIDTVGAAGCINSTIEDMANWVLLHLNEGKFGDHELISSELLQQMYTPHNSIPDQPVLSLPESPLNSYGLGWFISAYRGKSDSSWR